MSLATSKLSNITIISDALKGILPAIDPTGNNDYHALFFLAKASANKFLESSSVPVDLWFHVAQPSVAHDARLFVWNTLLANGNLNLATAVCASPKFTQLQPALCKTAINIIVIYFLSNATVSIEVVRFIAFLISAHAHLDLDPIPHSARVVPFIILSHLPTPAIAHFFSIPNWSLLTAHQLLSNIAQSPQHLDYIGFLARAVSPQAVHELALAVITTSETISTRAKIIFCSIIPFSIFNSPDQDANRLLIKHHHRETGPISEVARTIYCIWADPVFRPEYLAAFAKSNPHHRAIAAKLALYYNAINQIEPRADLAP